MSRIATAITDGDQQRDQGRVAGRGLVEGQLAGQEVGSLGDRPADEDRARPPPPR